MTALIDTDVALDVLLKREPWLGDSQSVWQACDAGLLNGYLAAISFTNIYYVGRRQIGPEKAIDAVRQCLESFDVAPVRRETVAAALAMSQIDFEDNVQIASAIEAKLDRIVNRNTHDFRHSPVPVVTPAQIIAELKAGDPGGQTGTGKE